MLFCLFLCWFCRCCHNLKHRRDHISMTIISISATYNSNCDTATNSPICATTVSAGYLTEPLKVYKPTRQLRSSSDTSILCLSLCARTRLVRDVFLVMHRLSGTLPCKVRSSNTLTSFKSSMKSHLRKLSYW